ncbi:MAG: hypothetical protein WAW39_11445 [Prosthecobacter sp.]|uniref:hypothetical protein n=1 Tax=Prosthecobacter sp. TaxID=1965333 RepID=UPI003BB1149D
MAVPLSKLQETIQTAALAVTNATEVLFTKGLYLAAIEQGIQFTVQVYDDTMDLQTMQENQEITPQMVTKTSSTETPAGSQQQQTYGRSSESEVIYEG